MPALIIRKCKFCGVTLPAKRLAPYCAKATCYYRVKTRRTLETSGQSLELKTVGPWQGNPNVNRVRL